MNQLPPVPPIGLTLSVPKERVEQAIDQAIAKGRSLLATKATGPEMMDDLKRKNWSWVLETSDKLKECFTSESVPLYFSSNPIFTPSLKVSDFERDLDEFPFVVGGRLDRLAGLRKIAAVVPEPPRGDYIAATCHPVVYHAAWRAFELGQYGQAIALCVKEIEDHILLRTAGSINATGADLVRQAFEPETGCMLSPEVTASENQGIADLLAGFFLRYKNIAPATPMTIQQGARVLSLSSYLLYMLDAHRVPKKEEEGAEPKEEQAPYEFEFLKE